MAGAQVATFPQTIISFLRQTQWESGQNDRECEKPTWTSSSSVRTVWLLARLVTSRSSSARVQKSQNEQVRVHIPHDTCPCGRTQFQQVNCSIFSIRHRQQTKYVPPNNLFRISSTNIHQQGAQMYRGWRNKVKNSYFMIYFL